MDPSLQQVITSATADLSDKQDAFAADLKSLRELLEACVQALDEIAKGL